MIIRKIKNYYLLLLSITLVLIDQYSKYYIYNNSQNLLNNSFLIFKLNYVKNYGAAFNILEGNRFFLIIISLSATFILLYLILFLKKIKQEEKVYYSIILGGTLGNAIDRILNGYVLDFIEIKYINFPIFNLADLFINVGFIGLIYIFLKSDK